MIPDFALEGSAYCVITVRILATKSTAFTNAAWAHAKDLSQAFVDESPMANDICGMRSSFVLQDLNFEIYVSYYS